MAKKLLGELHLSNGEIRRIFFSGVKHKKLTAEAFDGVSIQSTTSRKVMQITLSYYQSLVSAGKASWVNTDNEVAKEIAEHVND